MINCYFTEQLFLRDFIEIKNGKAKFSDHKMAVQDLPGDWKLNTLLMVDVTTNHYIKVKI